MDATDGDEGLSLEAVNQPMDLERTTLVENSETSKLINSLVFIAIVVGEAHLGNDR